MAQIKLPTQQAYITHDFTINLGFKYVYSPSLHAWPPSSSLVHDQQACFLNLYNHDVHYGMGYDPVNDDYKIVHDNFPYELRHRYPGVLVNGALHWLAGHQNNDIVLKCLVNEIIAAFDPVAEKYWMLQFTPISDFGCMTLGELGGCLCLFCICKIGLRYDCVELWVMKDYKVHASWTRLFKADWGQIYGNVTNYYIRILAYSKNCNEVLQINDTIWWFDEKEQREVDIGLSSFEAEICVASLVKLTG
ncbi:F-box protein CPR1-like [Cornus florida]|uniref:F-box protein CPR1-like n=1 Tax=Cornus florida TaxID=4283 RepID=UPI00289B4060|nr:F-box protein CPR1-like [Cornus florida]